jgi:hypothetical protein
MAGMLYWRGDYFENLRRFASLARAIPEWSDYASFCEKYEQGLRQEAFGRIEHFIEYLENSPFSERRKFVSWLLPQVDGVEGQHMLMPHPLSRRIIQPTLCEWIVAEPECAEPHLWLGDYDNLKHALALKPDDDVIRRKLAACILSRIDWATHELPSGYIGEPSEDLTALDEAERLIEKLTSEQERADFDASLHEQRGMILSYLNSRIDRLPPISPE